MKQLAIMIFSLFISGAVYAEEASQTDQTAMGAAIKLAEPVDRPGFSVAVVDVGAGYISGQPSEDALRGMAEAGVTTVINLRTKDEMKALGYDEGTLVQELGMNYVHIPLGGDAHPYSPAALDAMLDAMKKVEGKVLLHCASGRRASHMWGAYLVKGQGFSREEAEKHARAVGRGEPALDKLLDTKPAATEKNQ
ncbi:hypothetical protein GCM10017044_14550 [Kordiimonas sediminis]|uniref:Beta-lactamase hydrolase-like protein phosphatase-like domain-containing protein n=1 Tax=Kordiimonas sediminis TaxID=1735581 RepID=A0A919E755_9PROT|nr:protein tyrosine phosphatase family protein [Kordiimonas sediminis]GHF20730.1 hypothetical protein GCM10017044_14550 [Kordiimonas sediminis]